MKTRPIIYMQHGRWTWRFPMGCWELVAEYCTEASIWCRDRNAAEGRPRL